MHLINYYVLYRDYNNKKQVYTFWVSNGFSQNCWSTVLQTARKHLNQCNV